MLDIYLNLIKDKMCNLFGHRWLYKDYSNHIKSNGDKYDFIASRSCQRCNQHAYFYTKWLNEQKSKLDFENDFFSTRKMNIGSTQYS